jgi:hypothetical protein
VIPTLIDTGPSPRGWHRVELYLTCPMRYYWRKVACVEDPPRTPLVRGTLGHVMLAHFYAQRVATLRGLDPATFYSPLEASQIVADRYGEMGQRGRADALRGFERYRQGYVAENFEVIGIEKLLETHFDGFLYTARADLIVRVPATGKVWIYDHKFVGRIDDRTFRRYTLSGQFLGLHHLGIATYGRDFGGVIINVVGCNDGKLERAAPLPAPWALGRFPRIVAAAERKIADLEAAGDVSVWPQALSEYACTTPYGPCDFHDKCRWGK